MQRIYVNVNIETNDLRLLAILAPTVGFAVQGYMTNGIAGAFLGGLFGLTVGTLLASFIECIANMLRDLTSMTLV